MTATTPGTGPLRLLIVDDSALMRGMIKRVAQLSDVSIADVHEAANGAEAIRILETHGVDVMFTDINMPVMSGTDLLRAIESQPAWRDLVRVVVSTDGSAARRQETAALHVRHFIEKPFRPEVMRDVLNQLAASDDAD